MQARVKEKPHAQEEDEEKHVTHLHRLSGERAEDVDGPTQAADHCQDHGRVDRIEVDGCHVCNTPGGTPVHSRRSGSRARREELRMSSVCVLADWVQRRTSTGE